MIKLLLAQLPKLPSHPVCKRGGKRMLHTAYNHLFHLSIPVCISILILQIKQHGNAPVLIHFEILIQKISFLDPSKFFCKFHPRRIRFYGGSAQIADILITPDRVMMPSVTDHIQLIRKAAQPILCKSRIVQAHAKFPDPAGHLVLPHECVHCIHLGFDQLLIILYVSIFSRV